MISRRTVLRIGGGAGVLALGAGLARAIDQGLVLDFDRPGLRAWDDWNQQRHSGPLALVSAGILSASPHNSQPWRFAIGRRGVDLFEVPERSLGAMDPFGRERLLGLGAAIHTMALATTGIDRAAAVRLLPDPGNPLHVARIELGSEPEPTRRHPLLPAIGHRHTDRGAWAGGRLTDAQILRIAAANRSPDVRILLIDTDSPGGKRFAELTIEATAAIAGDTEMMADSHRWFRHNRRDQDRLKDGLGLATSGLSPFMAAAGAMLPDPSPASEGQYWLAATRDTALPTASIFGLIMLRDLGDRRNTLIAGGLWQRLHLIAQTLGLAAQPLNQIPEMIDRERQRGRPAHFAAGIDAILPDHAWRPTFAFRLGQPLRAAGPSPRRPVSEVIGAPARLGYDVDRARAETEAQDAALARKLSGG